MTKKEKLNTIKRWFHNAKEIQAEKPNDLYSQGFHDGAKFAYVEVIKLLMSQKEQETLNDWLWDI